jgi:hypothetical protein
MKTNSNAQQGNVAVRTLTAKFVDRASGMSGTRAQLQRIARSARVGLVLGLMNFPRQIVSLYGGTDKAWHGYTEPYRRHIGPLRFRRNVILEIGVGGYRDEKVWGSLHLWRDYLPRSIVVGIDIEEKNVRLGSRVRFFRADQANTNDLQRVVDVVGMPNIVIDDGSHRGTDVFTTFAYLFPRMPENSLYIIEDLHTSYWPLFGGGVPAPENSAVGLVRCLVDSIQAGDPTFRWLAHRHRPRPAAWFEGVQSVDVYPGMAVISKRRSTWRDLLRVTREGPISLADMKKLRDTQPAQHRDDGASDSTIGSDSQA